MLTGHIDGVSQEQTQIGGRVDVDSNGNIKKKKHKKHNNSTGQSAANLANLANLATCVSSRSTHTQTACSVHTFLRLARSAMPSRMSQPASGCLVYAGGDQR